MNTPINLLNTIIGDYRVFKFLGIGMDTAGNSRSMWKIVCEGCGNQKTKDQKELSKIKGICQFCTKYGGSKRYGRLVGK